MPCTLVRLAGCPLRCTYCDTPQAIPFESGEMMAVDDIVERVGAAKRPLVLITGGEPLAQRHCTSLLDRLQSLDAILQLETSGAFDISKVPAQVRRILDVKTPGSGEVHRNRWQNLDVLRNGDELKFILTDRDDFLWAVDCIEKFNLENRGIPILFSPSWGSLQANDLAEWILAENINVRLQIQQHKVIWGAETNGV